MEKLEILIGDDMFAEPMPMRIIENSYIPNLKETFPEYSLEVKMVESPNEVIEEAKTGKYDVVVTDLDYSGVTDWDFSGRATRKEGFDVINAVSQLKPRPLIILCTSSDSYDEIQRRTEGKIDYHAGKGASNKFEDLTNILIQHYKKHLAKDERRLK